MNLLRNTIVGTLVSFFLVATAFADQAAYISKADAEKTAAFLKDKRQIVHFCEPCGATKKTVEEIQTVKAVDADFEGYWKVVVNRGGIDLAYVYFKTADGRWKNLAIEMGIKVEDVSTYIEYDQ